MAVSSGIGRLSIIPLLLLRGAAALGSPPDPDLTGATSLWKFNPCAGKALGIDLAWLDAQLKKQFLMKTQIVGPRSEPDFWAPATGDTLKPGEVFGVDYDFEGSDGVRFLRIAGGRGWVYDAYPGGCTLCEPVPMASLWMSNPCTGKSLSIRSGPSFSAPASGDSLKPGTVFSVEDEAQAEDGVQFLRISGGRGWVYDAYPGGCPLCQPVMPSARLWIFKACTGKPFSIRSKPALLSQVTGDKFFPGEVFAVDHEVEGDDGVLFLRIVGGRGWAYDAFPGGCPLCQPIAALGVKEAQAISASGVKQAQADARDQAQVYAETQARAQAEAQARAQAEAQAQEEAKARAQAEVHARAQVEAQARAQAEAQAQEEAKARAQAEVHARAQVEAQARARAEAQAQEEAKVRAQAEVHAGAQVEAEARAQAEDDRRSCSAHAGCDTLSGLCCPTADGVMLGCCGPESLLGSAAEPDPLETSDEVADDSVSEATSMWRVVHPRGVDIRSSPHDLNARTGEGRDAGAVFGVSEILSGEGGVQFLRLSDGKGWLFDSVPGVGPVCEQIEDVRRDAKVQAAAFDEAFLENLTDLENFTELSLEGYVEDRVDVLLPALQRMDVELAAPEGPEWWRFTSNQGGSASLRIAAEPFIGGVLTAHTLSAGDSFLVDELFHGLSEDGGDARFVFLHLADGRGWITDSLQADRKCEKILHGAGEEEQRSAPSQSPELHSRRLPMLPPQKSHGNAGRAMAPQ